MYQPKETVKFYNQSTKVEQLVLLYPHHIPQVNDVVYMFVGPDQGKWGHVIVKERRLSLDDMETPLWAIIVQ